MVETKIKSAKSGSVSEVIMRGNVTTRTKVNYESYEHVSGMQSLFHFNLLPDSGQLGCDDICGSNFGQRICSIVRNDSSVS